MSETYNEEFARQAMGAGKDTGIPNIKASGIEDMTDFEGRGRWYMPADPARGILRDSINYPLLARMIIDREGLTKNGAGITNAQGQKISTEMLYKLLRDEISLAFPERPELATKGYHELIDAIPAAPLDASADGITAYIKDAMQSDITAFASASNIKTGFYRFDELTGGLYPGLYVIGALSSLGKTTFVHQLADQIAAGGNHVLFFSLEMARLEMASKSITRKMAQLDFSNALESMKIRLGTTSNLAQRAIEAYCAEVSDRMNVIEGGFETSVSFIAEYTNNYISLHNARPVVIVDYLQILQGAEKNTVREAIDFNVVELKRLSRALSVPVIVVSSVNRNNYLMPIDFESFKESGGIEYTADVVLGMQLACLDEDLFENEKEKQIKQKRDRIKKAKEEYPREISLVWLKNRYGTTKIKIKYKYYTKYDLFEEQNSYNKVYSE